MEASGGQAAWTLLDLLRAAGLSGRPHVPGFDPSVDHFTVDSRDVRAGTCFVALPGSRTDGHAHVAGAVAAGAAAVIVQDDRFGEHCPIAVEVTNTREAVARLAAVYHGIAALQQAGRLTLVGVTGTNGKTTVCTLLRAILACGGQATAQLGTLGNDLLTARAPSRMTTLPPLELCADLAAAARGGATHAVIEVSSHALDQRRCAGLDFVAGVFTNLTHDHLDYHPDFPAYARAKKRLFDDLAEGTHAVTCADDPHGERMMADTKATVIRFGLRAASVDVGAEQVMASADGNRFVLRVGPDRERVCSALIGRHNMTNMLAAAAAAHALGVPLSVIRAGLESVTEIRGRLQRVTDDHPCHVFVDYAHTPDALRHVLAELRDLHDGRTICVFGCGGGRDRLKRPLMGRAVADLADVAIVTSDNPRDEDPAAIIDEALGGFGATGRCATYMVVDRREAIFRGIELARPGDVVLVAGKGHEDYQIVGGDRRCFDDVQVSREALAHLREVRR